MSPMKRKRHVVVGRLDPARAGKAASEFGELGGDVGGNFEACEQTGHFRASRILATRPKFAKLGDSCKSPWFCRHYDEKFTRRGLARALKTGQLTGQAEIQETELSQLPVTRRQFAMLGAAAAAALGAPGLAFADAPKPETTADMAALLKPGTLPELIYGDANAPVAFIEYGSLTCPHCAAFDRDVLPKLKAAYFDTGKVKMIFREFVRNPLDGAAFALARCIGDDKALAASRSAVQDAGQMGVRREPAGAAARRHASDRPHA